ncbi:MAG: hypothetical protein JOZ24_13340 [Candidatus Eremiobacteraeota bacterium]|nr:hypothetical protein [Candidatus Eremiobacteraeota bacterium]
MRHVAYAHTMYGPLKIGRVSFTVDANNSTFTFPATPSDPKLSIAPIQQQ